MSKPDNTQAELRETDLDHQGEDVVTKALVGFANDLLAYEDRMERVDSPILFIHKYVEKRKRQFDSIIAAHTNKQVEAVLNEMLVDVSSPSANIDQAEMIELINLHINKLKESD